MSALSTPSLNYKARANQALGSPALYTKLCRRMMVEHIALGAFLVRTRSVTLPQLKG